MMEEEEDCADEVEAAAAEVEVGVVTAAEEVKPVAASQAGPFLGMVFWEEASIRPVGQCPQSCL
jgi:hypothetical protein